MEKNDRIRVCIGHIRICLLIVDGSFFFHASKILLGAAPPRPRGQTGCSSTLSKQTVNSCRRWLSEKFEVLRSRLRKKRKEKKQVSALLGQADFLLRCCYVRRNRSERNRQPEYRAFGALGVQGQEAVQGTGCVGGVGVCILTRSSFVCTKAFDTFSTAKNYVRVPLSSPSNLSQKTWVHL